MKTNHSECPTVEKRRDSNLELYRVIAMLLIIAHHYVVNSGILTQVYEDPMQASSVFALLFGAWGKIGINCFVLITGYFMCKSQITLKKFAKLVLEVMFYRIIIYAIFLLTGYEPFSLSGFIKMLLPVSSVASNFTGCYLVFYLCIPFLNILIRHLTEKNHLLLVLLCLGAYTIIGSIPTMDVTMNYVSWFIVLYLIASYIRIYPRNIFANGTLWGWITAVMVLLSAASVVVCAWIGNKLGRPDLAYYFVSDCNRILALATGLASFLFFKNLKIPYNRLINLMGASTFGVLLIHANGDAMRRWLWQDVLKNKAVFGTAWLVPHAIVSVIVIFVVCCAIDVLRIRFLEKPFFRLWDRHYEGFAAWYRKKETAICEKLKIQ